MDSFTIFEAHRIALLLACMLVAVAAAIIYDASDLPNKEPRVIRSHLYQYAVVVAFLASISLIFAHTLALSDCRLIPDAKVKAVVDQIDHAEAADLK